LNQLSSFELSNQETIFHKIWYKHHATKGQPKSILLKNLQPAITKLGVHELVWNREQNHLLLGSEWKYNKTFEKHATSLQILFL
jgi:hypothetical protein